MDADREKLKFYLQSLVVLGEDISFEEKSDIIKSLHDRSIRETVAAFLREVTSPRMIRNPNALKTLGELLKYLLTAFVHERDDDYKCIYAIL